MLHASKRKNEALLGNSRKDFKSVQERLSYMGKSYEKRRARLEERYRAKEDAILNRANIPKTLPTSAKLFVDTGADIGARAKRELKKRENSRVKLKSEKDHRELKECTFAPEVNTTCRQKNENFFSRLESYKRRKSERLERAKRTAQEELVEDCTFTPVVSEASRRMGVRSRLLDSSSSGSRLGASSRLGMSSLGGTLGGTLGTTATGGGFGSGGGTPIGTPSLKASSLGVMRGAVGGDKSGMQEDLPEGLTEEGLAFMRARAAKERRELVFIVVEDYVER